MQLLKPATVLQDSSTAAIGDQDGNVIGWAAPVMVSRLLWAGSADNRYVPPSPAGETTTFGIDFSRLLPIGVGIKSGTIQVQTNTATPADASANWTIGPVTVQGRVLFASLSGGVSGTDYRIVWTVTDTAGDVWVRTTLVLCAPTG